MIGVTSIVIEFLDHKLFKSVGRSTHNLQRKLQPVSSDVKLLNLAINNEVY